MMNIILLEKVDRLGKLGDVVSVKPGFARNFLLPFGKAKVANAENIKELEGRRAELEAKEAESLAAAEARKAKLDALKSALHLKPVLKASCLVLWVTQTLQRLSMQRV